MKVLSLAAFLMSHSIGCKYQRIISQGVYTLRQDAYICEIRLHQEAPADSSNGQVGRIEESDSFRRTSQPHKSNVTQNHRREVVDMAQLNPSSLDGSILSIGRPIDHL